MRTRYALLLLVACGDAAPPQGIGDPCNVDRDCEPYICEAEVCSVGTPAHDAGLDAPPPMDVGRGPDSAVRHDAGPFDGGMDAGPLPSWASGTAPLVGVFADSAGVWVVTAESATLLDTDAGELFAFSPGRDITAAAYRDGRLVVADLGKLNVFEGTENTEAFLLDEWCSAVVALSGSQVVCVHGASGDRTYALIDLLANVEVSDVETGARARRFAEIPGGDHFIGHIDGYFEFFGIVEGQVRFVTRSPASPSALSTEAFTLVGSPTTHIVTSTGTMIRVDESACNALIPTPDCLTRDEDLGVVPVGGHYVSMTSTPERVFGLLPATIAGDCFAGCTLHEVDVAERRSVRSWDFQADFARRPYFPMVHDSVTRRILLPVATRGSRETDAWRIYVFDVD